MASSRPYRLIVSGIVRGVIETQAKEAKSLGQQDTFIRTLAAMVESIESDPTNFGDPQVQFKGMHVDQYIVVRGP